MRIIENIVKIASTDHEVRKQAILDELTAMGVEYELQHDAVHGITNIVVSKNPSEKRLVIMAHYDSVWGSPGANDNGAACGIMLEIINRFKDSPKSVDFVFTDYEELGFVGSTYYIKTVGAHNIGAVINLDMCGQGNNIVVTHSDGPMMAEAKWLLTERIKEAYDVTVVERLPGGDQVACKRAGIPYAMVIASTNNDMLFFMDPSNNYRGVDHVDFIKTMHRPTDIVDKLNEDIIEKIADYVSEALMADGNEK